MNKAHTVRHFLQNISFNDLPSAVIEQAKVCCYDLLATAVGGGRSATVSIIT